MSLMRLGKSVIGSDLRRGNISKIEATLSTLFKVKSESKVGLVLIPEIILTLAQRLVDKVFLLVIGMKLGKFIDIQIKYPNISLILMLGL